MEEFLTIEALVIVLVLVATLVAVVVRRIRLPYTVSLVLVGLFISIQRPVAVEVTPELILSIFVPPLIFEAAFHLDYRLLRKNLASIIMLAVPGVILTTLFVGGVVALGTRLSFATAVVFGALIAMHPPASPPAPAPGPSRPTGRSAAPPSVPCRRCTIEACGVGGGARTAPYYETDPPNLPFPRSVESPPHRARIVSGSPPSRSAGSLSSGSQSRVHPWHLDVDVDAVHQWPEGCGDSFGILPGSG